MLCGVWEIPNSKEWNRNLHSNLEWIKWKVFLWKLCKFLHAFVQLGRFMQHLCLWNIYHAVYGIRVANWDGAGAFHLSGMHPVNHSRQVGMIHPLFEHLQGCRLQRK